MDGGQRIWDMSRDEWLAAGGAGEVWDQLHIRPVPLPIPVNSDGLQMGICGVPPNIYGAPNQDPTGRDQIDWSAITRDCAGL